MLQGGCKHTERKIRTVKRIRAESLRCRFDRGISRRQDRETCNRKKVRLEQTPENIPDTKLIRMIEKLI